MVIRTLNTQKFEVEVWMLKLSEVLNTVMILGQMYSLVGSVSACDERNIDIQWIDSGTTNPLVKFWELMLHDTSTKNLCFIAITECSLPGYLSATRHLSCMWSKGRLSSNFNLWDMWWSLLCRYMTLQKIRCCDGFINENN